MLVRAGSLLSTINTIASYNTSIRARTQNLIGYRGWWASCRSRNNFLSKRCYPPKSATPAGQIAFDIPLNVTIWTRKLDGAQINDLPNKGRLEFSVLANSWWRRKVCAKRWGTCAFVVSFYYKFSVECHSREREEIGKRTLFSLDRVRLVARNSH